MADAKLSLVKLLLLLYFVAMNKDGIFEMVLTKYIGVTLKTAMGFLHKMGSAMGTCVG